MSITNTIKTGLAEDGNHLKLMSKEVEVEITRGQLIKVTVYLVAVIKFEFMTKVYFSKDIDQLYQFDTLVKAERKFNRLNRMGK